ncbi:MAG: hypothetical protein IPG70_02915 [Moraxellaceae bacterium]|nr:hypothetical protein [Moraxellaceae bacterium]
MSTSGSYRNYHEIDGIRYSHSIDHAQPSQLTIKPSQQR